MSGYYDPRSSRAYMNQQPQYPQAQPPPPPPQQQQQSSMYYSAGPSYMTEAPPTYVDENAYWVQKHTDAANYDYFHPYPSSGPSVTHSIERYPTSSAYPAGPSNAAGSSSSWYGQQSLGAPGPSSRVSRSPSPHPSDLYNYGTLNPDQRTWKCAYPGCNSKAVFMRPCDLRKHFHRHSKSYFCRHEGCPQATSGGFSSRKDRVRHEAKHNPGIECEWEGCERIFSRVDNMKDHLKRIHYKSS